MMLTIPMQKASTTSRPHASTGSVLVIGRSEKVLRETVDLLRGDGRVAGATNDFDNVLALFDVTSLDIVVFGGMVPPATKENLRIDLATANPTLTFVQGMAGIPGLIAAQVEAAAAPPPDAPASVTYDGDRRTVTISLKSSEDVRLTALWGTAFVPPDPESTSQVIFDERLGAGTHTLELPASVPTVASFVVVRAGTEIHPYMVGPMPRGTTATSRQTMKAIRLHEFGGPEVLRYDDVPVPEPRPGEVLIRVRAVGVNPPDWYLREGMPNVPAEARPHLGLPAIPGTDVSGTIVAVAGHVDGLSVGDEVYGLLRFPGLEHSAYAEYVTAPASDLAPKPAGIDHVHAAAVPMAGLTAWQFLIELGHDHPSPLQAMPHVPMPLAPGSTVLVNGAAGGVGHFAVQLARWKGARVIAVASGRHESFLRELGVDDFIDYTRRRPYEVAEDVDLVLDTVGGAESGRLLSTLRRGGALYPVFFAQYDPEEMAKLGVTTSTTQVRSNGLQLAELGRLLDAGTLHVAIDSAFPLADARKAHERAARGHIQGKIVLTVD